ncbi:MAG: hypothetical protein ACHREM_22500, partial [Polyangiales bacterium]
MAADSSEQESKERTSKTEDEVEEKAIVVRRPTSGASSKATGKGGAKSAADAKAASDANDDALMAATLRAMEWAQKRRSQLIGLVGSLVAAGAAISAFQMYRSDREAKASAMLAKGMQAEASPLKKGDEPAEALKLRTFYANEDEKQKAALASYGSARAQFADTGPGILGRLGEAGVMLDRREWDGAIAAYTEVRDSKLAAADINVKMRCIEGLGYAKEGKGDVAGARDAFDALANLDTKGAKPLGLYHLARLDALRSDKDGKDAAINKLKAAREAVTAPGAPSAKFLKEAIDKLLGKLDPTAVPKAPKGPPGGMGAGGMPSLGDLDALGAKNGLTPEQ